MLTLNAKVVQDSTPSWSCSVAKLVPIPLPVVCLIVNIHLLLEETAESSLDL